MKYSEAKPGRVFVVRLQDGDVVHECLERFAREKKVAAAAVILLGGADEGSRLVVGPEKGRGLPVSPMERVLDESHEAAGVGTIFPNEKGEPVLHLHAACGREDRTTTGCVRKGVRVWHVMEAIVWELAETSARRRKEPPTGFDLLQP